MLLTTVMRAVGIQVQHAFVGEECGVDGAQHEQAYLDCRDRFRCSIDFEGEPTGCATEGVCACVGYVGAKIRYMVVCRA